MSLDARFTQLRRTGDRSRAGPASYQRNMAGERISTLKNRLLAMEMAERPQVMAALSRGRQRFRGNFGGGVGVLRRSGSPFTRSRPRQRSNSLRRSNSLSRLTRSQSLQSLMTVGGAELGFEMVGRRQGGGRGGRGIRGGFRTRIFTRGSRLSARGGIQKLNMDLVATARKRRSASLNRLTNIAGGVGFRRGGRGGRGNLPGGVKARLGVRPASVARAPPVANIGTRGGGRGGIRGAGRGRGAGGALRRIGRDLNTRGGKERGGGNRGAVQGNRGNWQGGKNRGGFRGRRGGNAKGRGSALVRGRGGNRGGRGGRGGAKKPVVPTKEALDTELDQYMSKTKSYLDKQLDQYMAQPTASA